MVLKEIGFSRSAVFLCAVVVSVILVGTYLATTYHSASRRTTHNIQLYSPTPSPTRPVAGGTKIYVDTNCGYSFSYPASVSIVYDGSIGHDCPGGSKRIQLVSNIDTTIDHELPSRPPLGLWIEFTPQINWNKETFADYLEDTEGTVGCCVIDKSTSKEITLNNLRGYVGVVPDFAFRRYYFPLKHNKIFLRIDVALRSADELISNIIGSLQGLD